MAKKSKGGKPKHMTDAGTSSQYQDKIGNPDHMKLSDSSSRASRSGGDLAGPTMWGEQNGMDMGITRTNETPF